MTVHLLQDSTPTDQELADRVHRATGELNAAWEAALEAGLQVSVESFRGTVPLVAHVQRKIPAVITEYPPSAEVSE